MSYFLESVCQGYFRLNIWNKYFNMQLDNIIQLMNDDATRKKVLQQIPELYSF